MISTKICARQIAKMYDLVRAAGGLLNLLKVNMFLNLTDIEPVRAATDKSLLYTTEGEVSDELHGLPQTNTSFILLNMGYPMHCYWKLCDAFGFDYVFTSLHIHFYKCNESTYGPTTDRFNDIPDVWVVWGKQHSVKMFKLVSSQHYFILFYSKIQSTTWYLIF